LQTGIYILVGFGKGKEKGAR